jgi:dimethylaniline monooxygenase (N-oxide forming)
MPHKYVLEYFRLYADNFGLLKHINFKTSVESIQQCPDFDETGQWKVTHHSERSGQTVSEIFDGVLICSGHHTNPYLPTFNGVDKFQGSTMHSHGYRSPQQFTDKKVLVVGESCDVLLDHSV